ncbi:MAG: 1,4-dihydroxy-2-naphthoate octaprenyltransferase [Flavobacteriaceae bacterium]
MIKKARVWMQAARLRTLPLSVSGILLGNAYCLSNPNFSWILFWLMLFTGILFQIISNLANDYGDGTKGTDNAHRVGPKRTLQLGLLTSKELKTGMIMTSLLALGCSLIIIWLAFGTSSLYYLILFLGLSCLSVWAAVSYTVGNNAYGYSGLGDLFVFLFFGLLSVLGSAFVQQQYISTRLVELALIIGFLSVGVLNLNNMRDRENDAAMGKNTLVVFLGNRNARWYHLTLISLATLLMVKIFIPFLSAYFSLPLLALIPLAIHFLRVYKNKNPKLLDPELKHLALSTFAFSALTFLYYFLRL